MTKFLVGCLALTIGVAAFAQNSQGIAYGSGFMITGRGTTVRTDFWVASTPAGVYGKFWYEDRQRGGRSDNVEIRINRFHGFSCEDLGVAFYGEGYVNSTPRVIIVQALDGVWYPDLFWVGAFHPISMTLLYDRYAQFTQGGVSVLCDLPSGPDN
ncbi:MAG: hypothetical protein AMXMBFR61_17740 [Fimbriimonadales bacterium]